MAPSKGGGVNVFGEAREEEREAHWEAELANRYSDSDEEEGGGGRDGAGGGGSVAPAAASSATPPPPPPPPPVVAAAAAPSSASGAGAVKADPVKAAIAAALATANAATNADATAGPSAVADSDDWAPSKSEPGERGWSTRMDEFEDDGDGATEADDDEFYEEGDAELMHALESLDMREDLEARGGGGGGGGGGAGSKLATTAWRPNANGGAGNHRAFAAPKRGGAAGAASKAPAAKGAQNVNITTNVAHIEKTIRTSALDFGADGGNVGQRVGNSLKVRPARYYPPRH
jgi:hypothetical protein